MNAGLEQVLKRKSELDVAEQVVGDDDVEPLGLGQEEHARRVDVAVVGGDAEIPLDIGGQVLHARANRVVFGGADAKRRVDPVFVDFAVRAGDFDQDKVKRLCN